MNSLWCRGRGCFPIHSPTAEPQSNVIELHDQKSHHGVIHYYARLITPTIACTPMEKCGIPRPAIALRRITQKRTRNKQQKKGAVRCPRRAVARSITEWMVQRRVFAVEGLRHQFAGVQVRSLSSPDCPWPSSGPLVHAAVHIEQNSLWMRKGAKMFVQAREGEWDERRVNGIGSI